MCTDNDLVYVDVHNTVQLKASVMRKDVLYFLSRENTRSLALKMKASKILKGNLEKGTTGISPREAEAKDLVQLCGQHKGMVPSASCNAGEDRLSSAPGVRKGIYSCTVLRAGTGLEGQVDLVVAYPEGCLHAVALLSHASVQVCMLACNERQAVRVHVLMASIQCKH